MKQLTLHAERFTATGNIAAEGMRNQLGRPRLDRLAVLVREAAQNAWDAKREDAEQVTFGIACDQLDKDQLQTLRHDVFAELPNDSERMLAELLDRATAPVGENPLSVLTIYDRGTTGLGGPTRADAPSTPEESRDFIDFLRNVGQPPDKARGGGTFGYGKAALYLSSMVHTILVHTRCSFHGQVESRFMVSALTEHYYRRSKGYTGRHWWGREATDGIVDPVLGRDADRLAERLGMPVPEPDELGTTIMLLAPRLGDRDGMQAMNYLRAQMLWNFWPKMIAWAHEPEPRMVFQTSLNGVALPVPSPASVPPLAGFVDALRTVRLAEAAGSSRVMTLLCHRPKQKLGLLDLRRVVRKPRLEIDYGEDTELPEFVERCHHVALLRRAELVVTYHPGPVLPNDFVEYAGVFLADDEMDRVFAASEPPTHDEWRPENLADRRARTLVRTTFRRIDAATKDLVTPAATTHGAEADRPLARFSTYLGGLLVDAGGGGEVGSMSSTTGTAGAPTNVGVRVDATDPPPSVRRVRKPKVELSPDVELLDDEGILIRVFRARVAHSADVPQTELCARARTILAGGAEEREAPAGGDHPVIVGWRTPSGRLHGPGDRAIVDARDEGEWEIRVAGAAGSMIALELEATAVTT